MISSNISSQFALDSACEKIFNIVYLRNVVKIASAPAKGKMADDDLMPHEWTIRYESKNQKKKTMVRAIAWYRNNQIEFELPQNHRVHEVISVDEFKTIIATTPTNIMVCKLMEMPKEEIPFLIMQNELDSLEEVVMLDVTTLPLLEHFFICSAMVGDDDRLMQLKMSAHDSWDAGEMMAIMIPKSGEDFEEQQLIAAQKKSEVRWFAVKIIIYI